MRFIYLVDRIIGASPKLPPSNIVERKKVKIQGATQYVILKNML